MYAHTLLYGSGLLSSWKWKTKTDCSSQQLLSIITAVRQATKSSTRLEQASIHSLTKTSRQKQSKHDSWKWNQTLHSVGLMPRDSEGAWVMYPGTVTPSCRCRQPCQPCVTAWQRDRGKRNCDDKEITRPSILVLGGLLKLGQMKLDRPFIMWV